MRVIPVIDLLNGAVVRGIAGRRNDYRPIQSQIAADAQPATVVSAFGTHFGFDTVYVADLDAIQGRPANVDAWKAIAISGLQLWLDAGVGNPQGYLALSDSLASRIIKARIVVGLESLQDPDDSRWLDALARRPEALFSLDLKEGIPIHRVAKWRDRTALEIARAAHGIGFSDIIVLDLADVGMSRGTRTKQLCKQLAAQLHPAHVIAGGGVRGRDDLEALASAGIYAALVASALHNGRLTAEDVGQAGGLTH